MSVDCIVCVLSMCCEGIFSDGSKMDEVSKNRVLSYQRILVLWLFWFLLMSRIVKDCNPLFVLYALILYSYSMRENFRVPQFTLLLENMIKRIKSRIGEQSRTPRLSEKVYNEMKELQTKFPSSLQSQITLCLCLVSPRVMLNTQRSVSIRSEERSPSIVIPESIREILDNRIKERKTEGIEQRDLDERMRQIRAKMQHLKRD